MEGSAILLSAYWETVLTNTKHKKRTASRARMINVSVSKNARLWSRMVTIRHYWMQPKKNLLGITGVKDVFHSRSLLKVENF